MQRNHNPHSRNSPDSGDASPAISKGMTKFAATNDEPTSKDDLKEDKKDPKDKADYRADLKEMAAKAYAKRKKK